MLNPIEEIMLKIVLNDFMESYDSDKKDEKQNKHECKCGGNCEHKEIVHCKDCEYYLSNITYCNRLKNSILPEDFCSLAKKKETIETITKDEYEILSMLKALGAEKIVYEIFNFVSEEHIYVHGENFDARILGKNVQMLKHLFNKQSERKIDDLMKLEVID